MVKDVALTQIDELIPGVIVNALGAVLTTTFSNTADVQPSALVMLNEYVPAIKFETVVVVPVPVEVTAPGLRVNVQVPVAGKPLNATEPVGVAQVGWVIEPTVGAAGVAGWVSIVTLAEAIEVQPSALVTVKV